ncbi:hypothetical protein AVEN_73995-1 [Araneus ventricosus]|uniref:Uncharacterized protein n=1 Tax=Araneus ventricosus TaxID=182803 RepID=A0A4Y2IC41_ARAVE|nr:hypothetical protein AVEN_73995-1 [Araneus ventricosus]
MQRRRIKLDIHKGKALQSIWIVLLKMVPIFSSSIRFHPFMKSPKRTTGRGDLRLLLLPPSKRDPSPRSPSHTDGFRFCERGSFPFSTIVFEFHDRMRQMEIERRWISSNVLLKRCRCPGSRFQFSGVRHLDKTLVRLYHFSSQI